MDFAGDLCLVFIKKSFTGGVERLFAFVGGILVSYGFFSDWAASIYRLAFPQVNFDLSGSFASFWIALTQILIVVVLSEKRARSIALVNLAAAVILAIVFMTCIELATGAYGQNSTLDILRFSIYVPVTWVIIALGASLQLQKRS